MDRAGRNRCWTRRIPVAVGLVSVLLAAGAAEPKPGSVRNERATRPPVFERRADEGELPTVRFDRAALREATRRRERVRLDGFPLRRGLEVELDVEPFRVTRTDTKFVLGNRHGADAPLDFDPSSVTLLRGSVRGRPGSRVVLALRDGHHTGHVDLGAGSPRYWISSRGRAGRELEPESALVFPAEAAPELPPNVPFCGVEGEAAAEEPQSLFQAATPPAVGLQHMELAVETDYELYQLFDDATDAAAYVTALYAQVSDIYLRDVDTRVELVFVRIWDTPDDLFNEVDPSPLPEFRSYWNANMNSVGRDVAQLLSGRRDYPFGGQAYLSTMCSGSAYGVVGYAQGAFPDPSNPSPYSYDVSVTAHELGHNAGTGHTHDPPNFIDTCENPLTTPQRGTIMSYCSQTWSGGNANRDLYFHSVVQSNIDAHLAASSCIVDDCNANGVADNLDISGATSPDVNGNGVPDECEDCDSNGTLDPADIGMGAPDVDGNGIPDVCEPDCNANSVPDHRDTALATSLDAYGNDIPDECETDCNTNGTSDYTEIQLDMTLDVNRNAELDSCEDCDGDSTSDLVELGGAHDLWLASGLAAEPIRQFHATTGVLRGPSTGSLLQEAQDVLIVGTRVFVSSAADDRVAEFTLAGSYVGDLVTTGLGGLAHPAALAIAANGNLLVASRDTNEVLAYDATTGASLGAFVTAGLGGLIGPFGMAIGPSGNLYVTRSDGGVVEYDGTDGSLVGTFVDPLNNGGLDDPRHILFKPDRNLLVTSYGNHQTFEYQRDTGFPLGRWALSGNATRLNQESPWGLRIAPNGNVFIVRTGEAFGSSGGGSEHEHDAAALHLTNAQIYEFDVRNGNFLRAHVNGNDHGIEFPTGFDFVPGYGSDCNANQVQDDCDISAGTSLDVDTNTIPDECELDCNGNGTLDRLDIIPFGTSTDCNDNLVPDECDTTAGTPLACEPTVETDCTDGFDNDRDGHGDCADSDCDTTGACLGDILAATTFPSDAEMFGYVDDAFRSTSAPAYASGSHQTSEGFEGTGGLRVDVGGIDGVDIVGMSGGWRRSFTLTTAEAVTIQLRYRMDMSPDYEPDEFSQVMLTVDGTNLGIGGNDYIVQLTGDDAGGEVRQTGWQTIDIDAGLLSAGAHTLTIGLYNNKKTFTDEFTTLWIDDVGIVTVLPVVCGDATVSPGEDCDDGGTADGDCCSSSCGFEIVGSGCDDVDACTDGDTCDGMGVCAGSPISCDDRDPCTADSCDEVTGCANDPIPMCGPPVPTGRGAGAAIAVLLAVLGSISLLAARRSRTVG